MSENDEADAAQVLLVQGYIRALEVAVTTHAHIGQIVNNQIAELREVDRSSELRQLLVTLELQASTHMVGLTTAIAALAQLAGGGYKVRAAPEFPEEESP